MAILKSLADQYRQVATPTSNRLVSWSSNLGSCNSSYHWSNFMLYGVKGQSFPRLDRIPFMFSDYLCVKFTDDMAKLCRRRSCSLLSVMFRKRYNAKLLVEQEFQETAVEPVDNMRYKLMELLPNVPALKGTAWNIPVESASQDMIMLARCFYCYYEVYDGTAPQYRKGTWKHVFKTGKAEALFHPLQHRRFPFDTPTKRSDIWTPIQKKVINDPQYDLPKNDTPFIYNPVTDLYWTSKK
ncbi:hypothetical protein BDB01DRAFT_851799 [Pilobolus umbonatus]|nr:hypothetical protein BDB01DRAFT_851799 [Pilobolus umbonatus]